MTAHDPIEIQPPDITPWRQGNTGVDYVHMFDSGVAGPTAMVQALTHGNEFCGALALDFLFRSGIRPARGKLIAAFANVEAYARFDVDDPHASRYVDEDYNRVWGDEALFGSRDSIELRRARQLRPFVDRADALLDIHSMHEACRPIMVCGKDGELGGGGNKGAALARQIGLPADLLVDTGHPAGLRMIERGGLGDPASPRRAALIECGQHWERAAEALARDAMLRFLAVIGLVDAATIAPHLSAPLPPRQRLIRVTEAAVARSMDFRFHVPIVGLGIVEKAGTLIASDGERQWHAPYENTVLVMPSMEHLRPGNTQVRFGRVVDA